MACDFSGLTLLHLAAELLAFAAAAFGLDHSTLQPQRAAVGLSTLFRLLGSAFLPARFSHGFKFFRQTLPSSLAVHRTRAVLGGHHMDARRAVDQPHKRFHFIYILPTRPRTPGKAFLDVINVDAAISETSFRGAIRFYFPEPLKAKSGPVPSL